MMKPEDRTPQQRVDSSDAHPFGDAGQIVLAILFLVVWIADSFFLHYTTTINAQAPLTLRVTIGGVNVLIALYLGFASHREMFKVSRDTSEVIRSSVFGIVRHPMYLGEILLALGLLLMSLSIAAACVWAIAIVFFNIIARYEERQLVLRFGQDYKDYQQEVPMWLPRMRRTM